MTVKIIIEVSGPISEEDKLILTSATVALLNITNAVMVTEVEGEAEPPPPPPEPPVTTTTRKEVN